MTVYRIEKMRLKITDELRDKFLVAYDEWGYALAYSSDTLVVYDHNEGAKTFALSTGTFKWLTDKLYVLDGFLYYSAYKLGRIDADGILGFTPFYAWDRQTVYYLNGPVPGANPAAFENLMEFWARDDKKCFFQNRQIEGADAASFRAANKDFAVDRRNVYGFGGRVVAAYQEDPVDLGCGYYAVSGKLFYGSEEIVGADLRTFKVLPRVKPTEKDGPSPPPAAKSGKAPGGFQSLLRRLGCGPKIDELALAHAGFTALDARWKYRGTWHAPLP